jgi:hypothetical protein
MRKYISLAFITGLSALALRAQVAPGSQTIQTTGMIGLADAQTAQLNLLNPGIQAPAVGVICSAVVSFIDAIGTVLKSTTLTVPPGKSESFSLRSDVDLNLIAGDRREIRATIAMPPVSPSTATGAAPSFLMCKVIPTLEILDTVSGRTLVTLGHVETIPSILTAASQRN